jgi:hypothetical protein
MILTGAGQLAITGAVNGNQQIAIGFSRAVIGFPLTIQPRS